MSVKRASLKKADYAQASLAGKLLFSMPATEAAERVVDRDHGGDFFHHAVILLCSHDANGAMGITLNKVAANINFRELLKQVDINAQDMTGDVPVLQGGPVETNRGFVLHTLDYKQDATFIVNKNVGVTTTADILEAMVGRQHPNHAILAMGCAGWAAGQLEEEIRRNMWLTAPYDEEIVFGSQFADKWQQAFDKLGISIEMLSLTAGTA